MVGASPVDGGDGKGSLINSVARAFAVLEIRGTGAARKPEPHCQIPEAEVIVAMWRWRWTVDRCNPSPHPNHT